jgi:hypothetical protein
MIRVASLRLSSMQPLRAGLREPLAFHGWGATWSEQLHAGSRTQQQQGAPQPEQPGPKGGADVFVYTGPFSAAVRRVKVRAKLRATAPPWAAGTCPVPSLAEQPG